MYKSKLQEFCQAKGWTLPLYTSTKDGQDHCPQFKATVIVNDLTFSTCDIARSSKEAQNAVAKLALDNLTGSATASPASPSCDVQPPKTGELEVHSLSGAVENNCDEKSKEMTHLNKQQLQVYAQKRNLALPIYNCEREGPPHACRFKSKVTFEGKTYECPEYFRTVKDAENAAAKVAIKELSCDGLEKDDPGFYKNLLQELVLKEYSTLPKYTSARSGPSHAPTFVATVHLMDSTFTGEEAKTKKLAEMSAAKVAYSALKERSCPKAPDSKFKVEPQVSCPKSPDSNFMGEPQVTKELVLRIGSAVSSNSTKPSVESPSRLDLRVNDEPWAAPEMSSSQHKKIRVFRRTPNMALPPGARVMHEDEKWIAVTVSPSSEEE